MATESLATRPLPQDLDTERAILGAILVNNELLTQISDKLAPEDFSLEGHYHIFWAMRRLYQNNQPVELTVRITDSRA
jgi:replicative DNA helicase